MDENKKDEILNEATPKADKDKQDNNGAADKFKDFYTNIKSEFKKIIWPKRDELVKQTVIVIILCLLVGAIIFGMDTGLGAILQEVSGLI